MESSISANKALVTGGTGFLGRKLAFRLKEMGMETTIIGRNKRIGNEMEKYGFHFIEANLIEAEKIAEACKEQHFVFHVGAQSSPWGKYKDFYQSNVIGTQNVVRGCEKHSIKRLIHVSSPSIYFDFADRFDIKENEPLPKNFANHYAHTKWLSEVVIDEAHKKDLPVITIRPRAIFGPGDTTILPRLIRANEKGFVPIIGGKDTLIDVTYVENVVDALILCMNSNSETLGRKYNITNGEPVYLVEVMKTLFELLNMKFNPKEISYQKAYKIARIMEFISKYLLLGKEPILTKYSIGVLAKSQTLNIEAAERELGYKPRISIKEGLEKFAEWWGENEKD